MTDDKGPGTPYARAHWMWDEMEKRFLGEPYRSDITPEEQFFRHYDELRSVLTELVNAESELEKLDAEWVESNSVKNVGESQYETYRRNLMTARKRLGEARAKAHLFVKLLEK